MYNLYLYKVAFMMFCLMDTLLYLLSHFELNPFKKIDDVGNSRPIPGAKNSRPGLLGPEGADEKYGPLGGADERSHFHDESMLDRTTLGGRALKMTRIEDEKEGYDETSKMDDTLSGRERTQVLPSEFEHNNKLRNIETEDLDGDDPKAVPLLGETKYVCEIDNPELMLGLDNQDVVTDSQKKQGFKFDSSHGKVSDQSKVVCGKRKNRPFKAYQGQELYPEIIAEYEFEDSEHDYRERQMAERKQKEEDARVLEEQKAKEAQAQTPKPKCNLPALPYSSRKRLKEIAADFDQDGTPRRRSSRGSIKHSSKGHRDSRGSIKHRDSIDERAGSRRGHDSPHEKDLKKDSKRHSADSIKRDREGKIHSDGYREHKRSSGKVKRSPVADEIHRSKDSIRHKSSSKKLQKGSVEHQIKQNQIGVNHVTTNHSKVTDGTKDTRRNSEGQPLIHSKFSGDNSNLDRIIEEEKELRKSGSIVSHSRMRDGVPLVNPNKLRPPENGNESPKRPSKMFDAEYIDSKLENPLLCKTSDFKEFNKEMATSYHKTPTFPHMVHRPKSPGASLDSVSQMRNSLPSFKED
jgi:hypothetical protein